MELEKIMEAYNNITPMAAVTLLLMVIMAVWIYTIIYKNS